MAYILVDITDRNHFYPFTLTRSLADCRVGILSFQERWEHFLKEETGIYTIDYLQILYSSDFLNTTESIIFINTTCIPTDQLVLQIKALQPGEKLMSKTGRWIATNSTKRSIQEILLAEFDPIKVDEVNFIDNAIQMIHLQSIMINKDFEKVCQHRTSEPIHNSNLAIEPAQIFIEKGATVLASNLNASNGPIYIGKEAVIMEGSSIRGPFVLGYKSVIKMNSAIYGSTSIGPNCTAGGEIKNSILMGYSNKAHEGYLGDSILGFWCNLGAGTSNSNLKNTAGQVQFWNEDLKQWDSVGQKMGMLVGDYSRFAIQSSINTGSYIGVSANVFGNGLLPKYLPNFTWGTLVGYHFEKVVEDINNWMKMKGVTIHEKEIEVLKHLYKINQ